jgi:hypothetical protein
MWPTLPTVSWDYIISCPTTAEIHPIDELGFSTSFFLHGHRSLLHTARRRAPANRRAGLQNHSPLRSCTREGELGFWEALYTTAQPLHHGPYSVHERWCLPSSSTPSTFDPSSTTLLLHFICYTSTATSTRSVCAIYLDLFSDGCFTICAATIYVD